MNTPTCFGSRRNHLQGVSQYLAKAIYMVFCVHVDAHTFEIRILGAVVTPPFL